MLQSIGSNVRRGSTIACSVYAMLGDVDFIFLKSRSAATENNMY